MLKYLVLSISGVLAPTLEDLILNAMPTSGDNAKDRQFQHWVHERCLEHYRGELSINELSNQIVERSGLKIDPGRIRELQQINFDGDVFEILEMIRDRFEFIFFSDLPLKWSGDHLKEKAQQSKLRVAQELFKEEIQDKHPASSILDLVLAAINKPADQLLLVDRNNQVTTQAVRRGVNAILFVNPFRLQQELRLRKLL